MVRTIPELDWTKKAEANNNPSYLVQELLSNILLEDSTGSILLEASVKRWTKKTINSLSWE